MINYRQNFNQLNQWLIVSLIILLVGRVYVHIMCKVQQYIIGNIIIKNVYIKKKKHLLCKVFYLTFINL